jgi:TatD DNase family protein
MHPQAPDLCDMQFLEELAVSGRLAAVGEAGFDFFGDRPERIRTDDNLKRQREVFEYQLDLARRFDLPILLHVRKAMDLVFEYSSSLKRLSSVIFHSYPGTAGEAHSLLDRGVPAWFSFGASLINGNKRAGSACASIPLERLLVETDAPWQPPRRVGGDGSAFCRPEDIRAVLSSVVDIRVEDAPLVEKTLAENFFTAFRLHSS